MQVPMISYFIYIKSKKPPRMATLTYMHFGNPGRRRFEAHYIIVHKKLRLHIILENFQHFYVKKYSHALQCPCRRPHAAAAGGRMLAAAVFLILYT